MLLMQDCHIGLGKNPHPTLTNSGVGATPLASILFFTSAYIRPTVVKEQLRWHQFFLKIWHTSDQQPVRATPLASVLFFNSAYIRPTETSRLRTRISKKTF